MKHAKVSQAWATLRRELSNEVLFDESIEAARNACVAGASISAAAIVAAAYSDSPIVGIQALRQCMRLVESTPLEVDTWCSTFTSRQDLEVDEILYAPGFGHVSKKQAALILSICNRQLKSHKSKKGTATSFYSMNHRRISAACGCLNQVGLLSLICVDNQIPIECAERQFMMLRIECAIIEAQKSRHAGLSEFPFLTEGYVYEGTQPILCVEETTDYLQQIGLE